MKEEEEEEGKGGGEKIKLLVVPCSGNTTAQG
jgi:hypothetical protein